MKKIISILILAVTIVSCQEEVSFNNPSFEGYKDNTLWRAKASEATYTRGDSTLTIKGYRGNELVLLKAYPVLVESNGTNSFIQNKTFELGKDLNATAMYQIPFNGINQYYETGEKIGVGEIVIENVFDQKFGTISGTYRFDAPKRGDDSDFPESVNFQYGVFYEIPLYIY